MTNSNYPGRPNYEGPDSGLAGLVHHNVLYEYCYSFSERVAVIRATKPEREVSTRLDCLLYLPLNDADWCIRGVGLLEESRKLRAESLRLRAESRKLLEESRQLWAEGEQLGEESEQLLKESGRLREESDSLREEGDQLLKERTQLWKESGKLFDAHQDEIRAAILQLLPELPWNGQELVFP